MATRQPISSALFGRLGTIFRGADDPRIRATWRVLLAMPVLWMLTGGVLAGNVQSATEFIPNGGGPAAGLAQSLLHGGFFVVALAAWARYFDHQPLSNYGVSVSLRWGLDLLVGFAAVVGGFAVWLALGGVLGRTTVEVSMSYPQGSFLLGLVILVVALVIHGAIQQVVFFRVILKNAAEGLHSRGIAPARAVIGALLVAILFFIAMHNLSSGLRILDLAVASAVFGLLYLHTEELALGIGAHFGALFAGNVLFVPATDAAGGPAVFQVSGSLPGILGVVNQFGFPKMVVAYLLVVAWLQWRNDMPLERGIARWTAG